MTGTVQAALAVVAAFVLGMLLMNAIKDDGETRIVVRDCSDTSSYLELYACQSD